MDIRTILKLGCRIQMKLDGEYCSTIVEGIEDEENFSVSCPWVQRRMIRFKKGQELPMSCTSSRGIYIFTVRVGDTNTNGNIPLVNVSVISEPKRYQRRMGYRVPVMLGVTISKLTRRSEPTREDVPCRTKTIDISEYGMLFLSDKGYRINELLLCDIKLDRFGIDMTLEGIHAVVKRCVLPVEKGAQCKVGVMFIDCTEKTRSALSKFIIRSQREGNGRKDRNREC